VIKHIRDFRTRARTRSNPGGHPQLDVVAATGDSLRELFDVRTDAEVQRCLERCEVLGLLLAPDGRRTRWVKQPDRTRKRMYVFAGNDLSVRRALRADRYDNPPESSGTRVRVLTWQ
jgi:hypothetical protein